MSQWLKCRVVVQDLAAFKTACKTNKVTYEESINKDLRFQSMEVHAILRDQQGPSYGYLCRSKDGFVMAMDSDPNYSSLTRRLGANGGRLGHDYAAEALSAEVARQGGSMDLVKENPDGSSLHRIRVYAM